MKKEIALILGLFVSYVLLFNAISGVKLPEKKDPYAKLYDEGSNTNSGGSTTAKAGASSTASFELSRNTVWGKIKTDPNNVAYFFDTVLLPRKVFGVDFHMVHKLFFKGLLLLVGLVGINSILEMRG